jgi:hypothetical protein
MFGPCLYEARNRASNVSISTYYPAALLFGMPRTRLYFSKQLYVSTGLHLATFDNVFFNWFNLVDRHAPPGPETGVNSGYSCRQAGSEMKGYRSGYKKYAQISIKKNGMRVQID